MWQLIGWLGLTAINLFFYKNHKDDKDIEEASNWLLSTSLEDKWYHLYILSAT